MLKRALVIGLQTLEVKKHSRFYLKFYSMALEGKHFQGFSQAKSDIYKGMTVDTKDLYLTDKEFEENLTASLTEWIASGKRGVWFKVSLENSSFIPILVKHGFCFHHAKTTYAMLTRWLPGNQPNLLPQFPHTHVGVAGMVVNEQNQILTIQEKYLKKPVWKLPGGYSNPGEDLAVTACREVFEETGIETKFLSVVTLRHLHQHLFHCSDIYVVCHLKPLSSCIIKSNEEIADCQWMNIETYVSHPDVSEFNKFVMNSFLENQKLKRTIGCSKVLAYTNDRYHNVYHIQSISDAEK